MRMRGVVAGAAALGLALGGVASAKGFPVSALPGTWSGSWTNTTFGSTGAISATVTQPTTDELDFAYGITGNVFGCSAVGPTTGALLRNQGDFTDYSVLVKGEDAVFGKVTIKTRALRVKIRGKKTCNGLGPKSYRGSATFDGTGVFTGKLAIKVGGRTAHTTFTITKQP